MSIIDELIVEPGSRVRLEAIRPDSTPGFKDSGDRDADRARSEADLGVQIERMADLQYTLWAENRRGLLVVLQAMDTAGKDGVIRHVFTGLNPNGCRVTPFKQPSAEEQDHDFLWRVHKATPARGEIGVFNRSHYEDVLVVRVHGVISESVCRERYAAINDFEKILTHDHTRVIKIFLHISKEEQKKRLCQRLEDPKKNWKISPQDFSERRLWDDYIKAYEDALSNCSTEHAPWFIVPSDRKWYRNWAVAHLVRETLEKMDPKLPPPTCDLSRIVIE